MKIGMLTTYPPTPCGIATFTQSLTENLQQAGETVHVTRLVDGDAHTIHEPVTWNWNRHNPKATRDCAQVLNRTDVAVLQHEYGIFPGPDGQDVLETLNLLTVPLIAVLHTVPATPSLNQYRVLARICLEASMLVTMTATAKERLERTWHVNPEKIIVIPHGADDNRQPKGQGISDKPIILTWGLLGKGKGIEWALDALGLLKDENITPRYQVVGHTHPKVVEWEGEAYRDGLKAKVKALKLERQVTFDDRYLTWPDLLAIVRAADIIMLPYDSQDQVTSGVLTEAVAAGKPVISTSFPHAVELLSGGAGLLVPQKDPTALAAALRRMLKEPGLAKHAAETSHKLADTLLWPTVASQYQKLAHTLTHEAVNA